MGKYITSSICAADLWSCPPWQANHFYIRPLGQRLQSGERYQSLQQRLVVALVFPIDSLDRFSQFIYHPLDDKHLHLYTTIVEHNPPRLGKRLSASQPFLTVGLQQLVQRRVQLGIICGWLLNFLRFNHCLHGLRDWDPRLDKITIFDRTCTCLNLWGTLG